MYPTSNVKVQKNTKLLINTISNVLGTYFSCIKVPFKNS